mgnify:CR=1 FL=1
MDSFQLAYIWHPSYQNKQCSPLFLIQDQLNSKQSNISSGTGVTFEDGIVSIGQSVKSNDDVIFNSVETTENIRTSSLLTTDVVASGNIEVGGSISAYGIRSGGDIRADGAALAADQSFVGRDWSDEVRTKTIYLNEKAIKVPLFFL